MSVITRGFGDKQSIIIRGFNLPLVEDNPQTIMAQHHPETKEALTLPIISIIGTYTRSRYPITILIGKIHTLTHSMTQTIGRRVSVKLLMIQDVVSQQTLDEVERRLRQIMETLSHVDLEKINKKIKIITDTIKERYERSQNQQTPSHQS